MRAIDADKLLRDIEKYHVSDGKFQHWVQIQPTIEPETCEDDNGGCSNCMYSGRPTYKSPCSECHDKIQWDMKPISRSHENGVECEDAVSRQRLLNDLKELITAWEKYPVMAEQIKGVEAAIKYVEMIPSVTPKHMRGK